MQNVLQKSITVKKNNGKISAITYKNLNGFIFRQRKFEYKNDDMLEYSKKMGVNEFLPCKAMIHKFKGDINFESTYIGMDNKPGIGPNGYSTVKFERFDDENRWGLEKEITYFDLEGKAVKSDGNFHKIVYSRDSNGNIIEELFFDTEGNSTKNNEGVNGEKSIYNSTNQIIQTEYLDESKEKMKNVYGVAIEKYEYTNWNLSKISRFNLKNEIISKDENNTDDGASILKLNHNLRGNIISVSYYDENENPINGNFGYFSYKNEYDKFNNQITISFTDENNRNTLDYSGVHKYIFKYNENGLKISTEYKNSNLVSIEDPINQSFIVKFKYDNEGKLISQSYWKSETEKMYRWSGIHEYLSKFNDQGQTLEDISLDKNGNLKTELSGGSRVVFTYDKLGRISKRSVFNDFTPVLVNNEAQVSNYHSISYSYNNENKILIISYFDVENEPKEALINLIDPVHKIQFEYQGKKIVNQKWFGINNDIPKKNIDCITAEAMNVYGIGMSRLND